MILNKLLSALLVLTIILGIYFIFIKKNKELGYISFIFSLIAYFVPRTLFFQAFGLNNEYHKEDLKETTYKNDSPQNEPLSNVSSSTTKSQDIVPNTNKKPDIKEEKILENSFSGDIIIDGQVDYYEYIPAISGIYRFDFESNDVHTDYKFYIYLANNDKETCALYSNGGETIRLTAGQKYRIIVEQYYGMPQYTINIGVPSEVRNVENAVIKGTVSYTDQENQYTYKAPITGKYRFDFSINDVDCNYDFYLYSSNNKKIVSTSYLSEGKTVELVKDEVYTIIIKQHSGYVDYTIDIGIPNEVQSISENSISGSLEYIDQLDKYTYVAPITGKYRFDFYNNDVECNYDVQIYSSINEKLLESSSLNEGKSIDLQGGETYEIEIIQNTGIENYSINIGIPNDIRNVEENTISGTLNYTDQENNYLYLAPMSGEYGFIFEISDEDANYDFLIYTPNNKKLVETSYMKGYKIIQMEEGQVYTIVVRQHLGFPSYKIGIVQQ